MATKTKLIKTLCTFHGIYCNWVHDLGQMRPWNQSSTKLCAHFVGFTVTGSMMQHTCCHISSQWLIYWWERRAPVYANIWTHLVYRAHMSCIWLCYSVYPMKYAYSFVLLCFVLFWSDYQFWLIQVIHLNLFFNSLRVSVAYRAETIHWYVGILPIWRLRYVLRYTMRK